MAINLDRFNPSSRSNSDRNHNTNSNKPAIERMLTNLFEPHALDDTDSFPTQDSIPLADWEALSDIDVSTSANAGDATPSEEARTVRRVAVSHDPHAAETDEDKAESMDGNPEIEPASPLVGDDGSEAHDDDAMTPVDADPDADEASEALEMSPESADAHENAGESPDLEPNAAAEPDAEQIAPVPDDADRTMAASFTPTLVRLPVPPRRGSVPKFLADLEAKRNPDDTAMRPLPYYNFNWMNEDPNTQNAKFADLDESYDEDYDDGSYDGFDTYDEYDDFDEGYDDRYDYDYEERRPRRKTLIALVAAVAVISFVAGGAVARLSSQVPVLFGDKPETNETQASYSEKPKEQVAPDQAPAPEEVSPVQTEPQPETPQAPSEQQTPAEPEDTAPNPPSFDIGDDTTDDWGNTDSQQEYGESPDSSDENAYDNAWRWDLDQDGNNSITYNQNDNEVTFNYDGYQLTVPIGELIGYSERPDASSPYENDTLYENDGTDSQRYNDYGTGYDTEEYRDRDLWGYRPQSNIWS